MQSSLLSKYWISESQIWGPLYLSYLKLSCSRACHHRSSAGMFLNYVMLKHHTYVLFANKYFHSHQANWLQSWDVCKGWKLDIGWHFFTQTLQINLLNAKLTIKSTILPPISLIFHHFSQWLCRKLTSFPVSWDVCKGRKLDIGWTF